MDAIMTILAIVFIPLIIIFLVFYVMYALALYTLAKNNGYEDKAILAWIPVAHLYLFGLLGGDVEIFGINIRAVYIGVTLITLNLITGILQFGEKFKNSQDSSMSSYWILTLLYILLSAFATYNVLKRINEKNALVLSIIDIFIPIVSLIYLFIHKNTIFEDEYEYYYEDEVQESYSTNQGSEKSENIETIQYDENYNELK